MKIKVKVTGYSDNKVTERWYQSVEVNEYMIGLAMKKSTFIVSPPTLGTQSYPSLHQNHGVIIR